MDIGIISKRYARALMKFARRHQAEDRLYEECKTLVNSYQAEPDLRKVLENPLLPRQEKLKLICTAAVGNATPSEQLVRFIELVLSHHRENYLQFICLIYIDMYRKFKHVAVARLTTAVPLTPEMEKKINALSGRRLHASMELRMVVDPAIEGGFIFDINDYRLDASVAAQIRRIKRQFIEKNKKIV
ncbi:MAG: F0F1 ATP synthase subunit delta [Bacteroides sp.]|nr:F0F1 ATP synthase subunit delta [Bacteroides sp.]